MTLQVGDLIHFITVRDGLGRPRAWKLAEVIGFEDRKAVVSFYKSFKDENRTVKRFGAFDIEPCTKKYLDMEIRNYQKYMAEVGDHRNEEWKLLKELGYIK